MKNRITSAAVAAALMTLPLMAQADIVSVQPLNAVTPPSPLSCFDFHTTLKTGSTGNEVRGLQFALIHEGSNISLSEYGTYGLDTFAAVNAFQQKYAGDILAGGMAPTGIVGKMTRAKLNALYGCGVVTAPLIPSKIALTIKSTVIDLNGITTTFCNNSSTDVPVFPTRLRVNSINRDFNIVSATKAGACDTVQFPYSLWGLTFDASSTYSLVTIIDPFSVYKTGTVTYPLTASTTLNVPAFQGVHLSVRGMFIKSNGIQSTVCNLGTVDLTSYPVLVAVNGTSTIVDVPAAYKHGQCPTVTWTYDKFGLPALPPSGTVINATVTVDPNLTYKDLNELDNSATITGSI
jgi:peptidoglycan hydrolase-like protein with peptidoglycan-binding domain